MNENASRFNWEKIRKAFSHSPLQRARLLARQMFVRLREQNQPTSLECSVESNEKLWMFPARSYRQKIVEAWGKSTRSALARIRRLGQHESSVPQSKREALSRLWWTWNQGLQAMAQFIFCFYKRYGAKTVSRVDHRKNQQRWKLHAIQLSLGHALRAATQSATLVFLFAPLLLAQTARVPGPGGEFLGTPPLVNTSASANGSNVSTITLNFTAPATQFGIVAHLFSSATGSTFSNAFTCAGAGPCSAPSTDLVQQSAACSASVLLNCELYVCDSHLASGASSITITASTTGTNYTGEVEILTGEAQYSCLDQYGESSNAGSANPSITTVGNLAQSTDLVIGALRGANTITVGTGFTSVQAITSPVHMQTEKKNTAPSSGSTTSATYTMSSGGWAGIVSAWAIRPVTPQMPQIDSFCQAHTTTTQTFCTLPAIFANEGLVVDIFTSTTAAFSSLQDCTGSSACGGTTDTFTPSLACTTINTRQMCEYYICQSALGAGAISITLNTTGTGTVYVDAKSIRGMATSSCYDTGGTNSATSTNPTVTTSGNIATATELLLGWAISGTTTITAASGARALSGSGTNEISTFNITAPASGGTATSSTTAGSSSWTMINSAWKSQ